MLASLKVRVVLWYSLVVLLTLLAFNLITFQAIRRLLFDDLDASLRTEVEWITQSLRSQQFRNLGDSEIRSEITSRSILNARKEFIEIYDPAGNLFYRSPNILTSGILRPGRSASDQAMTLPAFEGRDVRLFSRTDEGYQVCVAYPLTDIQGAMDKLSLSFIALIPAALLLTAAGGIFLVSRFLRPIKRISTYADLLISRPLDDEIEELPKHARDEIGILKDQIHTAVLRMRKSMRQVLSFSSLASHELRTPLTVMRNELESALGPGLSSQDLRKVIASTYDENLRMNAIVDDLLSLGTIGAGTFRLNSASVNLLEMLEEFHEEAVPLVRDKGIPLTLTGDPDLTARLDTPRVRQVLFNLLENVVKHGGGSCRIDLSCRRDNGHAVISFADNGRGIPRDNQARIFDPFYRGSGSEPGSGTGLGLALVRGIVEAHGGTIALESEPGRGTTFRIALPASE